MNKREAPSSLHNPTATKKKKRVTIHEDLVTPGDSGWNDDAIEDYAIEEDLEPSKGRKGGVKTDAYGSDDDESGGSDSDDATPSAKSHPNKHKLEEDADMFGDDDSNLPRRQNGKASLKSIDIEGQEWGNALDDGNQVKIEPFNMDRELEEGAFDESGHYIQKKDEHRIHDSWLSDLSPADIERASKAKALEHRKSLQSKPQLYINVSLLWRDALNYMKPTESFASCLRRLGGGLAKKTPKWKKNKSKAKDKAEVSTDDADAIARFDEFSSLTSRIFEQDAEAYDRTYEQVVRSLRLKNLIDDSWVPGTQLPSLSSSVQWTPSIAKSNTMFQLKWGKDSQEVFGPHSLSEMKVWAHQGFLSQGDAYITIAHQNDFKHHSQYSFD